jgi:hypothetical protein
MCIKAELVTVQFYAFMYESLGRELPELKILSSIL